MAFLGEGEERIEGDDGDDGHTEHGQPRDEGQAGRHPEQEGERMGDLT